MSKNDLRPDTFEPLKLGDQEVVESLTGVYEDALKEAETTITWYLDRKNAARWWAQLIRWFGITGVALGALMPIGLTMYNDWAEKDLPTLLTTLVLGLAAALLSFDHYYGFSSAWIRYVRTAQRIREALETFRFDWELERIGLVQAPPDAVKVQRFLGLAKSFRLGVLREVQHETEQWAQEFQKSMEGLQKVVTERRLSEAREQERLLAGSESREEERLPEGSGSRDSDGSS